MSGIRIQERPQEQEHLEGTCIRLALSLVSLRKLSRRNRGNKASERAQRRGEQAWAMLQNISFEKENWKNEDNGTRDDFSYVAQCQW